MKPLFALSLIIFVSLSAFAESDVVKIETVHKLKNQIVENLTYNSTVLDYFWYGDDGIDCGVPDVELLSIDYQESKIKFSIIPAGLAHHCEKRAMTCELNFKTGPEGSILIPDTPVYLYGEGCEL